MKSKQFGMIVLWVLALVLPGGLPLMAAFTAARAVRSAREPALPVAVTPT